MPNQRMNSEVSARAGTNRKKWMKGSRAARAKRETPASNPSGMAMPEPSNQPLKTRSRLMAIESHSSPESESSAVPVATLAGPGSNCGL